MPTRIDKVETKIDGPSFYYTKTDDRRNKEYHGKLEVGYEVSFPTLTNLESSDYRAKDDEYGIVRGVASAIYGRLAQRKLDIPKAPALLRIKGVVDSNHWSKSIRVTVILIAPVEKPSEIPDQEQILEAFPAEIVSSFVRLQVLEAAEEFVTERTNECDQEDANHLLNWLLNEIRSLAKDVVRVDQRVAAIVGEYQSEVSRQLEKNNAELRAAIDKAVGEGRFSARAADEVWRWVRENPKELADDPVHHGFFSSGNAPKIKIPAQKEDS